MELMDEEKVGDDNGLAGAVHVPTELGANAIGRGLTHCVTPSFSPFIDESPATMPVTFEDPSDVRRQ
jgi:hypothetical protein